MINYFITLSSVLRIRVSEESETTRLPERCEGKECCLGAQDFEEPVTASVYRRAAFSVEVGPFLFPSHQFVLSKLNMPRSM